MGPFEQAWQILKFYGKPYSPEGHRDRADAMRRALGSQRNIVDEKRTAAMAPARAGGKYNPASPDARDYQREQDILDRINEAYPDLGQRTHPSQRGQINPPMEMLLGIKPPRDPGDEDNVATQLAAQEGVGAESSFQTEGMGQSMMQPTPSWQQQQY